jgi:hypothetical protein
LNQIGLDWAQVMSFYRFLNNPRVGLAEVIENQIGRHSLNEVSEHVLAISDTTSINLERHLGRLKAEALGYIGGGAGQKIGFHLHPTLVISAESFQILGLSSMQVWVRPEVNKERKGKYKQLPIEEKESNKWLRAAAESKQNLSAAQMITVIGDRESDVYEEFARVPDERTHLVIRSCQNRRLAEGGSLYERLAGQAIAGEYEIEIEADARVGREGRRAQIEVRFVEVEIAAPAASKGSEKPSVRMWAVEARERNVPSGVEPIVWRLLTTHRVETSGDARRIINYYRHRWWIEQLFRVLKKQGLDIESSELEQIESIKKLSVLGLGVAVKTLQLKRSLEQSSGEQRIEMVFNQEEISCLEQLNKKLEGRTERQQNPYQKRELRYGAWIIARLGGWKGYKSQRPPGVITIKRGLQRFETILVGFSLTCV